MPGTSGLELQKFLAAAHPIVFITAHEDNDARGQCVSGGGGGFLQKPFERTLLLKAVTRALELVNRRLRTP
jgi:two-component system response regulator FixJ